MAEGTDSDWSGSHVILDFVKSYVDRS
jgi:hypothetical protein